MKFLIKFIECENVIISKPNSKLSENISIVLKEQFDLLKSSNNFNHFIGQSKDDEIENSNDKFKISKRKSKKIFIIRKMF